VVETTVKRLLSCGFQPTGKVMGQVCQCWWRICQEINAFSSSNITCFTCYIYLLPIYWISLVAEWLFISREGLCYINDRGINKVEKKVMNYITLQLVLFAKCYLTYLLTELSPSWEAANCAAIQEIPSNFKYSQEPSTGPYPEQVRSSPYHPIQSL
jgi:hypothetical protein